MFLSEAFYPDTRNSYGISWQCKECQKARGRQYHGLPEVKRKRFLYDLARKFGITQDQWDDLIRYQLGLCAICGRQLLGPRGSHLDHDHAC